jgi:hypothetical protein
MGDWQSLWAVLPSTAAVINGVIAVLIANHLQDRPRAKRIWTAVVVIVAVLAVGATLYGQSRVISDRAAERGRLVDIRERIGEFISQGNGIMNECGNNSVPAPLEIGNQWASDAEKFLLERLGKSYATRFSDGAGVPSMVLNGADPAHQSVWFGVYVRVVRLEQFSTELSR